MRKISFPALAMSALLLPLTMSTPAHALSVDHDTSMNTDGTAKFADPDEQMPNFMNGSPEDRATPHAQPSVLLPVTPDSHVGLSVDHFGNGPQMDAFDQAYDRK